MSWKKTPIFSFLHSHEIPTLRWGGGHKSECLQITPVEGYSSKKEVCRGTALHTDEGPFPQNQCSGEAEEVNACASDRLRHSFLLSTCGKY